MTRAPRRATPRGRSHREAPGPRCSRRERPAGSRDRAPAPGDRARGRGARETARRRASGSPSRPAWLGAVASVAGCRGIGGRGVLRPTGARADRGDGAARRSRASAALVGWSTAEEVADGSAGAPAGARPGGRRSNGLRSCDSDAATCRGSQSCVQASNAGRASPHRLRASACQRSWSRWYTSSELLRYQSRKSRKARSEARANS